jgi:hypothetical protein
MQYRLVARPVEVMAISKVLYNFFNYLPSQQRHKYNSRTVSSLSELQTKWFIFPVPFCMH